MSQVTYTTFSAKGSFVVEANNMGHIVRLVKLADGRCQRFFKYGDREFTMNGWGKRAAREFDEMMAAAKAA